MRGGYEAAKSLGDFFRYTPELRAFVADCFATISVQFEVADQNHPFGEALTTTPKGNESLRILNRRPMLYATASRR